MNNLGRGSENNKKDKDRIFTRETMGIVLVLFAVLALVLLITRDVVFGSVGFAISSFLLGTFGYCSYAVLAALVYAGIVLITGKKFSVSRKTAWLCVLLFACLVCLVHTITAATSGISYASYGEYLAACYKAGENSFFQTTGGGVIFGLIVFPVVKLTTAVGGYIIFSLLTVGAAYLIYASKTGALGKRRKHRKEAEPADAAMHSATENTSGLYNLNYAETPSWQAYEQPSPVQEPNYAQEQQVNRQTIDPIERSKRLYSIGEDFNFKSKREMRQEARRAQDQQPPAPAPMSPYAQSHSILYPDRGNDSGYNWYNERFGGGGAPARSSAAKSTASADAPYSSYTSNRIFDKDSYFNNPNRGAISREQYSEYFRSSSSSASSAFSEGHERSTPRPQSPAAQQTPAQNAAPTYSEMYSDEAENNIAYSNRPKKIVADATHVEDGTNKAGQQSAGDFYRRDVNTEYSSGALKRDSNLFEPKKREDLSVSESKAEQERNEEKGQNSPHVDIEDTVRRAGFGDFASRRSVPAAEEPTHSMRASRDEKDLESAEPETSARLKDTAEDFERTGRPLRTRDEQSLSPETEKEEEKSSLQPLSEDFESVVNLFDGDEEPAESAVPEAVEQISRNEREEPVPLESRRDRMRQEPLPKQEEDKPRAKHVYPRYNAPPLDILKDYQGMDALDGDELEWNKNTIVETLSNLKIPSEIVKVTQGPAVTRYDIDIPGNIPTSRVLSCDKELAMRLHAKDGVNIQTNYENGSISIEVPNKQRATVGLKEILCSETFNKSKPGSLMFAMGKDIEGRAVCGDIFKMKHLLVSGATGSGKSICLHSLIISMLYKYSPEELRFIIIDPKQIDFAVYDKLPHLMINEILSNDIPKIINVLNWSITEMERRYALFREKAKQEIPVREIDDYNARLEPDEERLPKIVIIIDELADLMSAAKKEIEDRIQRLTQKSRAAGIHMVLSTQRPSVNVITGVIKTNLPTRIALKLTQEVDSRTILDESGAEKLLGNGDMLYRTDSMTFPVRLQGTYVSVDEMHKVVEYVREHNEAYFDDRVADFINNQKGGSGGGSGDDDGVEPVYIEALKHVVQIGQASISMIQRRCSVGYPKAGKIIEWMENMGYISAFDGAKARKVLLTQEEFDSKYGDYGD